MNKLSVFAIILVFILSIVFVSFFGMKINFYEVKVYAEKIDILNDDIKIQPTGMKSIPIKFNDSKYFDSTIGKIIYQIEWRVLPDNTTHKDVTFGYDVNQTGIEVTERGIVYISKKGTYGITIYVDDGSNVKETLYLIIY